MNAINVLSFVMTMANYGENLDQGKAQGLMESALKDLHNHMDEQDKKLNLIIDKLGGL